MQLLDLNNPKQVVNQLAALAVQQDFTQGLELQRIQFDLYVTLIYQGFLSDEQMTFHNVLDSVPFEFLPCPKEQAPSFYVTTATIDRTVKKYREFILSNIDVSSSQIETLRNVISQLPLSHTQLNSALIEKGVIPQPVSIRAIEHLFSLCVDDVKSDSVKAVNLYISSKNFRPDGTRYERNTRPSYVVFDLASKEKSIKALSTVVIRTAEIIAGYIGIVHLEHIASIVLDRHANKVKSLFSNNEHFNDFISVFLKQRYKNLCLSSETTDDIVAISDDLVESDISHSLEHYLSLVGGLPLNKLPEFLYRLLKYKEVLARTGVQKTTSDGKVSLRVVSENFEISFVNMVSSLELVNALPFSSVINGNIVRTERGKFIPNDDVTLAIGIGIDYLNAGNTFTSSISSSSIIEKMREQYASSFKQQLIDASKDPQGLFEYNGRKYSVNNANISRSTNVQGYYLHDEYLEVTDDIISKRNAIHDTLTIRKDVFKKGLQFFQKTFSNQSDHLPDIAVDKSHPNHERYISNRYDLLSYADYDSSRLYLINEIRRCDKQIQSLSKYLKYLESLENSSSYEVTIKNTSERLEKWQKIKEADYDLIVELESSDINLEIQSLKVKLDSLERHRKTLRIGHNQYKAHLLLHDYILKVGKCTQPELNEFINAYSHVLVNKRLDGDASLLIKTPEVVYNNLTKAITLFVTYHPFSTVVD